MIGEVCLQSNSLTSFVSSCILPLQRDAINIEFFKARLEGLEVIFTVIHFTGISHIVIQQNEISKINTKQALLSLIKQLGIKNLPAIGLILSKKIHDKLSIQATVLVLSTMTLIEETSCASGSIAAAIVEMIDQNKTEFFIKAQQKSGYDLEIQISGTYRSNQFYLTYGRVSGIVELHGIRKIKVG